MLPRNENIYQQIEVNIGFSHTGFSEGSASEDGGGGDFSREPAIKLFFYGTVKKF